MTTIHEVRGVLAGALSAVALVYFADNPASAGPIVPPLHYCMTFDHGGADCSFTNYPQCLATASGIDAECYGKTRDDDDGQTGLRRSFARAPSH